MPRKTAPEAIASPAASGPRKPQPEQLEPQLATLVEAPPEGPAWLHETKFDGFRVLARLHRGRATLFTRSGQDWTTHFPAVAEAAAALPLESGWLDGEVTVVLPDGRTSFGALQNRAGDGANRGELVYFVFDLLYADGRDLRGLALEDRKRALAAVLRPPGRAPAGPVRYVEPIEGPGAEVLARACAAGQEGIVSKRRDRPYAAGRNLDWVKAKCMKRQEFVIGGFTEPRNARDSVGALLVGVYEGKTLRYAGKVGTGFGRARAAELRRRLEALARATPPFSPAPRPLPAGVHWATPKLLAELSFTEMTADGKLRHPSFKGLRDDKPAAAVVREVPAAPPDPRPAAVPLTHPERVLWADAGVTKRDLADYYEANAERILPHLRGRPLALVRCPGGTAKACFFMKHAAAGAAPSVRRLQLREKTTSGAYLVVDDARGLAELAQLSVLELHTWGATEANLDAPDRLIFDLDPGPRVGWPDVRRAARAVQEQLRRAGLPAFLKTTGGKGLHVVVPLRADVGWDPAEAFARKLAETLEGEAPDRYTTSLPKAGREAKILIDYLRNHRGATAVAAFSPRARAGAPVSTPLAWDELDDVSPDRPITVRTLARRLAGLEADPWEGYEASRTSLGRLVPRS